MKQEPKRKEIDILKIRELHMACMTVDEIAAELGIDVFRVIYELDYLGYKPIMKRTNPN